MNQTSSCLAWCGVLFLFANIPSKQAWAAPPAAASPASISLTGKKWIDMNYGPCLTASLQVAPDNIAYKGIAIRLDEGPGGVAQGHQFVVFDTDTLRYAAAWDGPRFIDWRSIVYDGTHNTHPSIVGRTIYSNPAGPGWAQPQTKRFEDPRIRGRDNLPYGPLPGNWAHWKGLYLHQQNVILSYTVGDASVLEMPAIESHKNVPAWSRTLNLGPRSEDMVLRVLATSGNHLTFQPIPGTDPSNPNLVILSQAPSSPPPTEGLNFDGATSLDIAASDSFDFHDQDFTITARIKTSHGGTILAQAPLEDPWQPDGKAFFIRNGHLCFDIGWVGAVQSKRRVSDGQWHHVAVTFNHHDGQVKLYIDGQADGQGQLKPKAPVQNHIIRLGYTSPNFPEPDSFFKGTLEQVSLYGIALPPNQIEKLASNPRSTADDSVLARWNLKAAESQTSIHDDSGHNHTATLSQSNSPTGSFVSSRAAFLGGPSGTKWMVTEQDQLGLFIPSGPRPAQLKILVAGLTREMPENAFHELVRQSAPPQDLIPLTRGGPAQWPETIQTKTRTLGFSAGPYAIESITEPSENPYRSWMRLGGFDFFEDGNRAAVCTWMGDVWLVDGLGSGLGQHRWKRIASGMFQPLGLKIVDGTIYVTCRDQITRLHDFNQDGEIDFYENFNNDAQVTEHFHEFAMDLQTDADGNFYYAKGARHAKDALVPQHGTLIKISPDGKHSEIVARGFRAPNGVCVNADGTFYISDQEGHWTPKNRINHVRAGGFYGNMMAYHDGLEPNQANPPVTWIHNSFDRSPAEQLWVTSDLWGPLRGSLISLSYGAGHISLVLRESKGPLTQGGVIRLPIPDFPTGIMRGRFHPGDGQLYVCGLFGWAGNKTRPGGLYRVRYTGKPVHIPIALNAKKDGIKLTFTNPLDPRTAGDSENYAVSRWTYRRTSNYGSRDYRFSNPEESGRDEMVVSAADLSPDRRTVFLKITDMQPVMQMEIRYKIRAADGAKLDQEIENTVHFLAD